MIKMISSLAEALRIHSSASIAFIGAGGKSTALFQLAKELPPPVIVTATSHLGIWQTRLADRHIITQTSEPLERLEHGLSGVILVTGEVDGDRTKPINDDLLHWLRQFCGYHSIPLLIEADGSRGKPLKAWGDYEPPIPAFAELVVQVCGMMGLGELLLDQNIHRAERFSALSGLQMSASITSEALARVLIHRNGGLKNMPANARRVVLLNQADTSELQASAQRLVQGLIPVYDSVVISSLKEKKIFAVHERVAGVVLAAGGSTRFGQPKQLLEWKGQSFVSAVARTALEAGLSPVIVVTGANGEEVASTVSDLNVITVRNDEWKSGQASSIRAGIRASSTAPSLKAEEAGGAIFLLADQPQVTTSILRALVEKHAESLAPIVAPLVMDQRANPVLFDRVAFGDLLKLEGDVGGRAVFHKHRVEYLPWHDARLLLDVDTPEMYRRLISDESP